MPARRKQPKQICPDCHLFRGGGGRHRGSDNCKAVKLAFDKGLTFPSFFEPVMLRRVGLEYITAHVDGRGYKKHLTEPWVELVQTCDLRKTKPDGSEVIIPWGEQRVIQGFLLRKLRDPSTRDVFLAELEIGGIPESWGFSGLRVHFLSK